METFTVAALVKMLSSQNQDAVVIGPDLQPVVGVEIFGGMVKINTSKKDEILPEA